MKKFIAAISFIVLCLGGFSQEFKAKLPMGNKLKVGEALEVELVFRYPSTSSEIPVLRDLKANSYLSTEIEILKSEDQSISDDGAVIEMRKSIFITVWELGSHEIPPISIYFDGDSIYTSTLAISTPELKVDLKEAPKDIKGIYEADWNMLDEVLLWLKNNWWVLLIITCLILAALYLKKYLDRRKENALSPLNEMKPEELAYLMLDKIEESSVWKNGDIKLYYTQISEVVWKYLEMHFDVPTADQTSVEILDAVKFTEIPKDRIKDLNDIFKSADLVKFAKSSPSPEEHELIMLKTRKFIDQTKHIPYRGNEQ